MQIYFDVFTVGDTTVTITLDIPSSTSPGIKEELPFPQHHSIADEFHTEHEEKNAAYAEDRLLKPHS